MKTIYLGLGEERYWSRSILPGISQYVRSFTSMSLKNLKTEDMLHLLKERSDLVSGFIGEIGPEDHSLKQALLLNKVCSVNIRGDQHHRELPTITHDNLRIGAMAAEHLLNLNIKHFGFAGNINLTHIKERWEGYRSALMQAGVTCVEKIAEDDPECLTRWLKNSSKPAGLFCAKSRIETSICERAIGLGFTIPNDLALIGIGDNPFHCELSPIPLSTIELDYPEVGYRAADLLCSMKFNTPRQCSDGRVAPIKIVTRQSSDRLATSDVLAQEAIRLIRSPSQGRIMVDEIARVLNVSRRTLETRFKKATGSTVYHVIHRERMQRAYEMVQTRNQTIRSIGEWIGISDTKRFIALFKKEFGQTPGRLRSERRGHPTQMS
ncbi:MAG: substrate-binding domain-containing protein [Verrucomicrobiota bacterium]